MNSYIKRRSRKRPNRKSGRGNALFIETGRGGKEKGRIKNEYYNNKQGIRSGGRELGKRLADITGYDYYDSEIIAAVAKKSGMDEAYIENTLSNHGWRNQAITFRGTLASSAYVESSKVQLPERKEAISGIAQMGKNCVIVGRNADVILREYEPLNIFVCASAEAKLKRCTERASAGENLSEKELLRRMKRIDGVRRQTGELMTGSQWG